MARGRLVCERQHLGHVPAPGWVSLLEILVLGVLAGYLVLFAVPAAFGIEWQCIGKYGVIRVSGDTYLAAVSVFGTLGWVLVAAAVLYARIIDSARLALAVPAAWFLLLVGSALLAAAVMDPQPCPV